MADEAPEAIIGRIDEKTGCPFLPFFLAGVVHDDPGLPYEGLVDTGFSEFIQLPYAEAFRLSLPLEGTMDAELADGKTVTNLTCLGRASLPDGDGHTEPVVGTVVLSMAPTILIGMEFLRAFERGLGVFSDGVFLIPAHAPPA